MKKLSSKRASFVIIGLIFGLTILIFGCKIYASSMIIGAKLEGEPNISTADLANVFIKNGFSQEKTTILDGLVFRKKALRDSFIFLKIESTDVNNTRKIFYEAANAGTGISVLFDVCSLKDKNDNLVQLSNVIQKIEKIEDDTKLCKKITVNLKAHQPLQEKAEQLLIDIKNHLFKNKNIALANRALSTSVLALQDYVDNIMNKSISGQICPVDILCHVIPEGRDKLNILLVRTEDQKELNSITISSEDDIKKLIAEILKYEKSKP